jgi:ABC-type multidrug transport system ATPase subunit
MTTPSSHAPAVEARGLHRVFRASRGGGEVVALGGIDARIERGEIFGLLGPNGAGKTTTIRMILDILRPDTGRIGISSSSTRWTPSSASPPAQRRPISSVRCRAISSTTRS